MRKLLKAALAAAMLTGPVAASAASYLVTGTPGADLGAAVAKAGGRVTRHLAAIDAVVAEGNGGFRAAIGNSPASRASLPIPG